MPDTPPTPGQACYEGYCAAHGDPGWFSPWEELLYERQAYWEAAAAAVQDLVRRELLAGFAQARVEGQRTREEDTP